MFSYDVANRYSQYLCSDILKVFNQYKQEEQIESNKKVVSVADELIKFKELLDINVITQEEFDKKKKE